MKIDEYFTIQKGFLHKHFLLATTVIYLKWPTNIV